MNILIYIYISSNPKMSVQYEHCLKTVVTKMQSKARSSIEMYADQDGMRQEEIRYLGGIRKDGTEDVWANFYDRLRDIKEYHRRFLETNSDPPGDRSAETILDEIYQNGNGENLFTGEENMGKTVDLTLIHPKWVNFKKLKNYYIKMWRRELAGRLQKKLKTHMSTSKESSKNDIFTQDLQYRIENIKDCDYPEMDYITFLNTFNKFRDIPRYCKYRDKEYKSLLNDMYEYLKGFFERREPNVNHSAVEKAFEDNFNKKWDDGDVSGWAKHSHKDDFYCPPTDRLFANQSALKNHKDGKQYAKAVKRIQSLSTDEQNQLIVASEQEDKNIARIEYLIQRYREMLGEAFVSTVQCLQKKQSRTMEEIEAEEEANDEDSGGEAVDNLSESDNEEDKPVYNPLNLPLGWDGKPIPYWLYKLHGLGVEYKCEICGNYSYWGRRAFERHFMEWRHAYGMRCLKIPNTVHFKEVTRIEEAVCLYEKLKHDSDSKAFRPDAEVEMEDIDGNVMSQRAYDDLRRQGLV
eukprot:GHVL01027659.1.p1 GENE.GHVL01027659.1~~GHVL01027659.1.p1  ORF type:complete len:520 (+),score=103.95 GHVL01027659.1:200-1759(+)